MADVTISSLPIGTPSGNNILPYSTGSNTLGAPVSAIFQNAGNVGIGTASPRSRLDVNGSIFVAAGSQIQITGNAGTDGLQLIGDDAAASYIGTMSLQALIFRTNAIERMRIAASGNVGIGTTAPAERLTVSGNVSASGDVKANNTAKAWVNFDGTGAIGTNQTIRSSYNVASVYKGNTGSYRITFTSAQTDNNYCVTGATAPAYSAYWTSLALHTAAPTNGGTESVPTNAYFDVCVVMQTVGKVDSKYVSVVVL
jgi:hypothetical protein